MVIEQKEILSLKKKRRSTVLSSTLSNISNTSDGAEQKAITIKASKFSFPTLSLNNNPLRITKEEEKKALSQKMEKESKKKVVKTSMVQEDSMHHQGTKFPKKIINKFPLKKLTEKKEDGKIPVEKPLLTLSEKKRTHTTEEKGLKLTSINLKSSVGSFTSKINPLKESLIIHHEKINAPKKERIIYPKSTNPTMERPILQRKYAPLENRFFQDHKLTQQKAIAEEKKIVFAPKHRAKVAKKEEIPVYNGITIQELSREMSVEIGKIKKTMKRLDIKKAEILTREDAEYICAFLDFNPVKVLTFQEGINELTKAGTNETDIGPITVTIAGHVNHGKTTLVESLLNRKDLANREKGNITQTIAAYKVQHSGHQFILIDTPGHDTFLSARENAMKLSDIVVVVIDLSEGIKSQTKEVIIAAQKLTKKIIIALNKMDHPKKISKDIINRELATLGVLTEDLGGEVMSVEISALRNKNIELLIDSIAIQGTEVNTYRDWSREAFGYFINSRQEKGIGIVGDVLIKNGTLRKGDCIILEDSSSFLVRSLLDPKGKAVESATELCTIFPLQRFTNPAERFIVINDKNKAMEIIKKFHNEYQQNANNTIINCKNVILKGSSMIDVNSLQDALELWYRNKKLDLKPNIVSSSVHELNEKDIESAKTFDCIIIMFNSKVPGRLSKLVDNVKIVSSDIIYTILDEIQEVFKKPVEMVRKEITSGMAEVIRIFIIDDKPILGCIIRSGEIFKGKKCIIRRGKDEKFTGIISSLRREKNDIKSAKEGFECGIKINGLSIKHGIKEGDTVECVNEIDVPMENSIE